MVQIVRDPHHTERIVEHCERMVIKCALALAALDVVLHVVSFLVRAYA